MDNILDDDMRVPIKPVRKPEPTPDAQKGSLPAAQKGKKYMKKKKLMEDPSIPRVDIAQPTPASDIIPTDKFANSERDVKLPTHENLLASRDYDVTDLYRQIDMLKSELKMSMALEMKNRLVFL